MLQYKKHKKYKKGAIKFKKQFRHLNYYSMPVSTLYNFRKRLNFVSIMLIGFIFLFITL